MPKVRLTSVAVERFRPPVAGQIEYYDTHLPAFGVRVSYSGTKAWFVMTRVEGKLTRVTLGRYPGLSLSAAREKAGAVFENAKAGHDPRRMALEQKRRAARERSTTFGSVSALFMERYVARHLRPTTAREYRRLLHGPDTQEWHSRPLKSVTRDDVVEMIARIEARGSPSAADRSLAYLSKFFAWCLEQDLIAVSATSRVRAATTTRSRQRVLSDGELAGLWRALDAFPGVFGPLFKIVLLTGQRRGEVAGMAWEEVKNLSTDDAVWELPPQRTKNGQAHLVPLVPSVQAVLIGLPQTGSLVFSTTDKTAVSGFSKAKKELDRLISRQRREDGLPPFPPWTLHDLRRTMVTVMNEHLGVAPHIVEAVVNHVSGPAKQGVAGVYNRALYLDDRRSALQRWAAYLVDRD